MADIPIAVNDRHIQLTALAAQVQFDADFLIFKDTDFTVRHTDNSVSPEVNTDLVLNTDYTVTGIGVLTGFSIFLDAVVFPGGAVAGDVFTIFGDIPIDRLADFQLAGDYSSATVNAEQDKITQITQELDTKLERSLRMFEEDSLVSIDNRLPLDRANKFLAFDGTKKPTASAGTTPGTVVVSTFMESVVSAANAQNARAAMQSWALGGVLNTGTVDALVATINASSLVNGMVVIVRATGANTGAVTFNLDALGVKDVLKVSGQVLVAGDIAGANHELELIYNSVLDDWLLLNPDTAAWRRIQKQTAAASATIDFVLPSGFAAYRLRIADLVPLLDGDELGLRVSNDGGATFVATANYFHAGIFLDGSTGLQATSGNAAATTLITLGSALASIGIGNATGESLSGSIEIDGAHNTARFTRVRFNGSHVGSGTAAEVLDEASGHYNVAEDNDAIRLLPLTGGAVSAGVFAFGIFVLEGLVA